MFIFVSGVSGAGKTTLIGAVLRRMPELCYLTTVTTRPRRPDEAEDFEYRFVSDEQYEQLRAESPDWDHTDYNGYKYGADAAGARQKVAQGKVVICSVAPDEEIIEEMKRRYDPAAITIWIDTPKNVARDRVATDSLRSGREEDESVKSAFDHIFQPSGDLEQDRQAFIELLGQMLTNNR